MSATPGSSPSLILTLLDRNTSTTTAWEVFKWWEFRRWFYNAVVGLAGMVTILAYYGFNALVGWLQSTSPILDPFLFIFVLPYALAANVCYTAGWISEIILRLLLKTETDQFAKFTFVGGTVVSVLLTLIPSIFLAGAAVLAVFFLKPRI